MMAAPALETPHCANCGVEIPWRPAVYRGQTYCCGGCAQGGPCYCSYDLMDVSVGVTGDRVMGSWGAREHAHLPTGNRLSNLDPRSF